MLSLSQPAIRKLLSTNGSLYAIGLGSGLINAVYQRFASYDPTDYSPEDVRRGVSHVLEICQRWEHGAAALSPPATFAGKRVLELGPGQSLGTGLVLLARGATDYTGVDVFPLARRSPPRLYAALAEAVGCSTDLLERAHFELVRFPTLAPLKDQFDVVVSNSTLEHVQDIPATFRTLRHLVSGFMVHHVDARVHLRVKALDPLNHLRYSRPLYRLMHYTGLPNRLLADDYRRAALEAGFSEVHIVPTLSAPSEYVSRVRPCLAPPFRGRQDLAWLAFNLVAR